MNFTLMEVPFKLDGENGFSRLKAPVIDKGASLEFWDQDQSGNIKLKDIGLFLRERIETYFKKVDIPIVMRYFDPSYLIRSSPANAADSVLCDLYARNAVHAAMAGKTGLVIGLLHDSFIHIPIRCWLWRRSTSIPTASGGRPFWRRPDNLRSFQ